LRIRCHPERHVKQDENSEIPGRSVKRTEHLVCDAPVPLSPSLCGLTLPAFFAIKAAMFGCSEFCRVTFDSMWSTELKER
jgi:hypothetical protein